MDTNSRTPPATPEARLAERTRNAAATSPGHPDWDQARGVQPRQPPKVIDRALVSDPRGSGEVVAPHGVRVAGDREAAHQGAGKRRTLTEKR